LAVDDERGTSLDGNAELGVEVVDASVMLSWKSWRRVAQRAASVDMLRKKITSGETKVKDVRPMVVIGGGAIRGYHNKRASTIMLVKDSGKSW
jgi:hypothetical protein